MVESLSRKRPARQRLRLPSRCSLNSKLSLLQYHWIYFFALYLLTSLMLFGNGKGKGTLSYLDSIFLAVSAGTGAGLNNIALSDLSIFQQTVCFLLIFLGSPLFVASIIVNTRRIRVKRLRAKRVLPKCNVASVADVEKAFSSHDSSKTGSRDGQEVAISTCSKISKLSGVSLGSSSTSELEATATPQLNLVLPDINESGAISELTTAVPSPQGQSKSGQNDGKFELVHNMLPPRNEAIGDDVYSALCLLSWLVPLYIFMFQVFAGISLGAWTVVNAPSITSVDAINPWWWGFFNSVSAFNNSGMALNDANMQPFATRGKFVVLTMCLLIVAGNTCFPLFLRFILWGFSKTCSYLQLNSPSQGVRLLMNERKGRTTFPYIFNTLESYWLAFTVVLLHGLDWAAFEIAAPTTASLAAVPISYRVLDGFFQGLAVRSGGFSIVNVRTLHIGVQGLYVAMMYISPFPLVLNPFYEAEKPGQRSPSRSSTLNLLFKPSIIPTTTRSFIKHQLRGLLRAGDLSWLSLCVWIIAMIESDKTTKDPAGFSVFAMLFEVASAYGCVGVSLGDPSGAPLAFSGALRGGSKAVLVIVMLLGRLREVRRGILVGDWGVGSRAECEDE